MARYGVSDYFDRDDSAARLLTVQCRWKLTRYIFGAEGETRTRTDIHPLDPEPSASTSSATSARGRGNFSISGGEPQKRAHSPQVLPDASASRAAAHLQSCFAAIHWIPATESGSHHPGFWEVTGMAEKGLILC